MREIERVIRIFNKRSSEIEKRIDRENARNYEMLSALAMQTKSLHDEVLKLKSLAGQIEKTRRIAEEGNRNAQEAVWAEIFNNTVSSSGWLKDKAFSPGRWAVGYPYLYVMYRVLNEARPQKILELGLGQSTMMITQYAQANRNAVHCVVEHDAKWIEFFKSSHSLTQKTEIVRLDLVMSPYKEAESVRKYAGFAERFSRKSFDFICIDAPFGGDMKQYARVDILPLLPQCLSENFVIMIDDCKRSGEAHTVEEIKFALERNKIPYKYGFYRGRKDLAVICAERLGFLTSM